MTENTHDDTEDDPYSAKDEAVAAKFADKLLVGNERPTLKLATRATVVAMGRWGGDIDTSDHDREYDDYADALEAAAMDTLDYYADEDAYVDGIDGLVFEGRKVRTSAVVETAEKLTDIVEGELPEFDRNEPGALVERVEPDGEPA